MGSALWLWARCEWRRRWGALVTLAVLVAVGGGATVAAVAAAGRTESAYPRFVRAVHQPNIEVNSSATFEPMDPALLDRAMEIDGVRGITEWAFAAIAPINYPNYFSLAMVGRRGASVGFIRVAGDVGSIDAWPLDAVGLNEAMADELHLGPGDTVETTSLTADQWAASFEGRPIGEPAGPRGTFTVTGIARSNEDITDAPDPGFLVSAAYLAAHPEVGQCACSVQVLADPGRLDTVTAALAALYPQAEVLPAEAFSTRIADTVSLQRRAWLVIAVVAAVAALLAVFQSARRVLRSVDDERVTRRALGLTVNDQRAGRAAALLPAALAGALGSVGIAYALSPLAPVGLTERAEVDPGLRFDPVAIGVGSVAVLVVVVGVFTGAALLAAPSGAWRAGRHGRHPVVGLGTALARGPGLPAMAGLALGVAGLVGAVTIERSIDHLLTTPAEYGADYDLLVSVSDGASRADAAAALADDPDLEAVGVGWSTSVTDNHSIVVHGPAGDATVEPSALEPVRGTIDVRITTGRTPGRPDEVAVGSKLLRQLGATVGDRIVVDTPAGSRDLVIVADNLQPGTDETGLGFTVTLDGLRAFGDVAPVVVLARTRHGVDLDAVVVRHAGMHLTPVTPPSEVRNIGQLGGLPGRVALVLVLLAIAALANAVVQTVRGGRRHVAVRRALGFTGRQVVAAHACQGVLVGTAGALAGGAVGFVVGRAVYDALVNDVGVIAHAPIPGWPAAATMGAAFALGAATFVLAGVVARRRRPGSVLRAE